jgi:hypothetical protein
VYCFVHLLRSPFSSAPLSRFLEVEYSGCASSHRETRRRCSEPSVKTNHGTRRTKTTHCLYNYTSISYPWTLRRTLTTSLFVHLLSSRPLDRHRLSRSPRRTPSANVIDLTGTTREGNTRFISGGLALAHLSPSTAGLAHTTMSH